MSIRQIEDARPIPIQHEDYHPRRHLFLQISHFALNNHLLMHGIDSLGQGHLPDHDLLFYVEETNAAFPVNVQFVEYDITMQTTASS